MNLNITIQKERIEALVKWFNVYSLEKWILLCATMLAVGATAYSYFHGYIIAYGDAESHLNIAKRVVDSLTPGFAQLGGIWLPLPHVLMIPFIYSDFLWRSGLAGSIVSGGAFILSSLFLYKITWRITEHKGAAVLAAFVFMINPNVLYFQSTPMTELTLIVFFILSSYYFVKFLQDDKIISLILAAAFGFAATLSRYDGWALVLMEAGIMVLLYFPYRFNIDAFKRFWKIESIKHFIVARTENTKDSFCSLTGKLEGRLVLYGTLAFFGIFLWLVWGWLILGDPLYFTHSQFSAASQQHGWLARGELPAYRNIWVSFLYYFVTSMSNIGVVAFLITLLGLAYFIFDKNIKHRFYVLLILLVPFFFNIATMYLGQSIIFIPHLTPTSFEWTLFNVRYGIMMVPFAAVLAGYLFYRSKSAGKIIIVALLVFQSALYGAGYAKVISFADGVEGLSSGIKKTHNAQFWFSENYDGGLVLEDDFARSLSLVRSDVPMDKFIYIGNRPYWEESLVEPQKYARWIVVQKNDTLWHNLLGRPELEARLYKYFKKVYTSPEILIFKRNEDAPSI